MAQIFPFRGIRYGRDSLEAVVAPPYDVISPDEQAALYAQHPRNVVRLILGREDNWYANAAHLFHEWLSDGALTTDDSPAVYVYRQTFADPLTGQTAPERIGLVCLLRLEEYETGIVLPHENTLTKARADRLELLRATRANFESIYGLYGDPDRAVESFLLEYADRDLPQLFVADAIGSSHTIERLADESAVAVLQNLLADKPVFIADGHHRYETSLAYRRELGPIPADHPANFILVTLTALEDEGLLVLPTHRLIRGADADAVARLPESLAPEFTVEAADAGALDAAIAEKAAQGQKAIGIVLGENRALLATLTGDPAELIPGALSPASKSLDVTLLHALILEKRLGIGADALAAGAQVAYTRDASEAARRVADGEFQAAFLLGRPTVAEMEAVSRAGEKMPQKSTFFYPKLLSGLLLRGFEQS